MQNFSQIAQGKVFFPSVTFGDPYGGRGVELERLSAFKHCSGPQNLQVCKVSAK
jgi:hypothetical protein